MNFISLEDDMFCLRNQHSESLSYYGKRGSDGKRGGRSGMGEIALLVSSQFALSLFVVTSINTEGELKKLI